MQITGEIRRHAGRSSSSTAIPSRIAPITRCRRTSAARATGPPAPFSVSPICCSGSIASEQPRAVLVGWDTYEEPTYRHEAFSAYQSGREFDDELIEQLAVIPEFVAACGFANAKRAGYEADDFLAAAAAAEERRGGTALSPAATATRSSSPPRKRPSSIRSAAAAWSASARPRSARATASIPQQVPDFIALRGDPSDKLPGAPGVGAQRRGSIVAEIRQPGGDPQSRPIRQTGRRFAALSFDRHHEPQGAAAASCRPDADMGAGGGAGADVAAQAIDSKAGGTGS